MIKKNPWTREEEWVLFLCHRQKGNQWAEIAQFLGGRTDNTIKNHWNSSMRKKFAEFKGAFDAQVREYCAKQKIEYLGTALDNGRLPAQYRTLIKKEECRLLMNYQDITKQQSRYYYEAKARELLDKQDQDEINYEMARMLLRELNMKVEDFMPSPAQRKTPNILHAPTTAPTTRSLNR